MNCSRPWWLILLHRMPGIQGNWSMAATEDTRFNAWEWLWPLCGRTLPDRRYCRCSSIYSACSPPFTGGSLLQIGKTLPQSDGTPTRQPKGSRTTCSLGFEHRLTTCEPSRAPILDCGPNPSFRPCDSGPGSRLSLPCMASCRSRKTVRAAESGIENRPGERGRTHHIRHSFSDDRTSPPSPHRCPIPSRCRLRMSPGSRDAAYPPVEVRWNRRVTVCSSARLLVYSSTRLLPSSTHLSLGSM